MRLRLDCSSAQSQFLEHLPPRLSAPRRDSPRVHLQVILPFVLGLQTLGEMNQTNRYRPLRPHLSRPTLSTSSLPIVAFSCITVRSMRKVDRVASAMSETSMANCSRSASMSARMRRLLRLPVDPPILARVTRPLRPTDITSASSPILGSPPAIGALLLSALRGHRLSPPVLFPLSSPTRFSSSVREPGMRATPGQAFNTPDTARQ